MLIFLFHIKENWLGLAELATLLVCLIARLPVGLANEFISAVYHLMYKHTLSKIYDSAYFTICVYVMLVFMANSWNVTICERFGYVYASYLWS